MSKNFLKKLQNYIFQEKLLAQGDSVVIGISGGSDSIGLALALNELRSKYDLKLQLVHINYHQRGEDSNQDEQFVQNFADKNKLSLRVLQYEEATIITGNLEERLRDFRYQQFEAIRQELKFDKIAVAHIQDDQAETLLMNLLRGSGLQGLTGIKVQRDFLIRPFLIFSKDEIKNFLKENQQKFCLDKTNLKADFTRNSIRLELIPFLEEKYNPKIKENLGKLAVNLQTENEINQFFIDKIYLDLVREEGNQLVLDISKFDKFLIGVWKRLFRKIIFNLKGDLKNISNNNFQEFKKIVDSEKSKTQTMQIGKIVLKKNEDCVIFSKVQ